MIDDWSITAAFTVASSFLLKQTYTLIVYSFRFHLLSCLIALGAAMVANQSSPFSFLGLAPRIPKNVATVPTIGSTVRFRLSHDASRFCVICQTYYAITFQLL
jgi:hypothetical protein